MLSPADLLARLARLPLLTGGLRDVPERQRHCARRSPGATTACRGEQALFRRLAVRGRGAGGDRGGLVLALRRWRWNCSIGWAGWWLPGCADADRRARRPRCASRCWRRCASMPPSAGGARGGGRAPPSPRGPFPGLCRGSAAHQAGGGAGALWFARLAAEHDTCSALRWASDSGEVATAVRLGAALWRFWYFCGTLDGRSRLAARADPGASTATTGDAALLEARAQAERAGYGGPSRPTALAHAHLQAALALALPGGGNESLATAGCSIISRFWRRSGGMGGD
ncbi:MAG: hypothetical protein U0232_07840 [Thermomicrobiales bacterium]